MELALQIAVWWMVAIVVLVGASALVATVLEWRALRSIGREIDRDLDELLGPAIDVPLPRRQRLHRSGR